MSIADKLTQLNTIKQNIKQAIINKGVSMTGVPFTQYHTKIAEIQGNGGGGDPGETPADGDYLVRFIDYDGTVLKEQWVNHGENATPPNLPNYTVATSKRPALTFQGWNNSYTNITENKDIGAIYVPTDGKTHAFVRLTKVVGKDVTLRLNKTDTSTLSIDWGDGITTTHTNSGNFNTSHTYSDNGDYEIKIWISSGSGKYRFGGGTTDFVFIGGSQVRRNMLVYLFIGDNVSDIRGYAFWNCYSLTNIVIPESVQSIGNQAFTSCYSLTNINLPASVSSIGDTAFTSCYSLTSIVIPENVSSIGGYAFQNCYSLTSIVIPENVSSIGNYTFRNCYSLTSIDLPASLSSIGNYAFNSCYSLTSIDLPASLSSIGNYAFNSCYSLTSIDLPASLSSMGNYTFQNCYSLASINLPASLSSMGNYTFQNCYSLASINLPANLESIESYAFDGCYSLTSIVIPASVWKIGDYAFANCYSILKYVFSPTYSPSLASTAVFNNINSACRIYVPDETAYSYKSGTNWNTYADYIYPVSEMEGDN